MRTYLRFTVAAAATSLALAPAVATAATVTHIDPRGDAPATYDILRTVYRNNSSVLRTRIDVADLKRRVGTQFAIIAESRAMRADGAAFLIYATHRADGVRSQRLTVAQNGHVDRIPCRVQAVWDFRDDYVLVTVPTVCLGEGYGTQFMETEAKWPPQMNPVDATGPKYTRVPWN